MIHRKLSRWVYELLFYLPDVTREMALLETPAERDAVRWQVWRRLYRSWSYWGLCAAVGGLMIPVLFFGMRFGVLLRFKLGISSPYFDPLFMLVYLLAVGTLFSVVSMWPLRRMVLHELRMHLIARQIPVCIACGYDLRGGAAARCPECGTATS